MYSGSSLVDLKAELSRKEEEFGKLRTDKNKSKAEVRNKTFQKVCTFCYFVHIYIQKNMQNFKII